jgi:hypothetical protein
MTAYGRTDRGTSTKFALRAATEVRERPGRTYPPGTNAAGYTEPSTYEIVGECGHVLDIVRAAGVDDWRSRIDRKRRHRKRCEFCPKIADQSMNPGYVERLIPADVREQLGMRDLRADSDTVICDLAEGRRVRFRRYGRSRSRYQLNVWTPRIGDEHTLSNGANSLEDYEVAGALVRAVDRQGRAEANPTG